MTRADLVEMTIHAMDGYAGYPAGVFLDQAVGYETREQVRLWHSIHAEARRWIDERDGLERVMARLADKASQLQRWAA